jgi:glycosyltransferase involved in cell wall biosynthesis
MRVTLLIQCFPPLLSTAGGVSKRYLKLCKCLIEEYHYSVTIITQIDIENHSSEIDEWIRTGRLIFKHINGAILTTKTDGVMSGVDLCSLSNQITILHALLNTDLIFIDDIFLREWISLLITFLNIPCIITSHTDFSKTNEVVGNKLKLFILQIHNLFTSNIIHATTTRVYAKQIGVQHTWPIMLWSNDFISDVDKVSIIETRQKWKNDKLNGIKHIDGVRYDNIVLYAGRFSLEKRIELLFKCIPDNTLLVIVGDNNTNDAYVQLLIDYANQTHNILIQRGMVNSQLLALYYHSCDLFLSASDFETCGNTVVEALAFKAALIAASNKPYVVACVLPLSAPLRVSAEIAATKPPAPGAPTKYTSPKPCSTLTAF